MKATVRFCGGCNPGYDRTEYWDRIRRASAGRIEWIRPEGDEFRAMLLICGCETACPRDDLSRQGCLVSVTNNALSPDSVVSLLEACGETSSQEPEEPGRREWSNEGDQDCRGLCPESEGPAAGCLL